MDMRRWVVAATLATVLAVAGCNATPRAQVSCEGERCTAQLSGNGTLVTIDKIKTVVRLDSVDQDGAIVSINAKPLPLRVGQSRTIAQTMVTLKSITDGRVTLVLEPSQSAE
ncbi:hypothetical protein [Fodinicola acaciae]|uniref:hypothetical protein n=1 Tax=Fodinicola acaciae TaxID=2681555 RepID=UPI0013CFCA5B|nr:hypothetical protein [Fodinicola acaciae]